LAALAGGVAPRGAEIDRTGAMRTAANAKAAPTATTAVIARMRLIFPPLPPHVDVPSRRTETYERRLCPSASQSFADLSRDG
jgi:hypothetical protein